MPDHLISLHNIHAGYNETPVLNDVTISVFDRDFIGVIGPNGGGKTTLIKVMLGLLKPVSGSIHFSGEGKKGMFGYLPQQSFIDHRFPITVTDIVLSGLLSVKGNFGRYIASDRIKAEQLLAEMGIKHLADRTAGQLSGGQLQRVLIARALISEPRLLILDEPNTFVDNRFEHELYELLRDLNQKMAIMVVSHDVGTISSYVKTIACVNNTLHYHPSNIITEEELQSYNCPLQIITHGDVPHTVLQKHADNLTSDHPHHHIS